MPYPPRWGPQPVTGFLVRGAPSNGPQRAIQAGVTSEAKVAMEANLVRHSVKVMEPCRSYLLDCRRSIVMQAQLDKLRKHLHIPHVILVKASKRGELLQQTHEELGEIAFLMVTLECRVKLLLAPFVRRLLSELPLHPLQVSPSLWVHCLALCIMWHKLHGQEPTCEQLQCYFGVGQQSAKSGVYLPHDSVGKVIGGSTFVESWTSKWFYLEGPWEISTYGLAQVEGHVPRVFCIPKWSRA